MNNFQMSWSQKEKFIYLTIILSGIILRFLFLDERSLHHDESLHAQYAHYFYDSPREKFYRYDPLLHGPLLYHLLPFAYWIFGVTQSSLRFIPAIAGSLLLFFPLSLKKLIRPSTVLWVTALFAFSPTFTYWSRFLNHDMLIIFFMACTFCLSIIPRFSSNLRIPLLATVMALQFCLKVNAYLHLMGVVFLLIFDFLYHYKNAENSLVQLLWRKLTNAKILLLVSLSLGILIFAYFYTAGFQHQQGFLDGLYRQSLSYWWEQHKIERISGPFIYYFLVLGLYEPLFFLSLFCIPSLLFKFSPKSLLSASLLSLLLAAAIFTLPETISIDMLKLKIPADILAFSGLMIFFIVFCYVAYRKQKYALGRLAFFFGAFTAIYSFAGEKVPWLALYPLFFALCFLCFVLNYEIKEKWFKYVLAVCILLGLSKNIYINFIRPGSAQELISQVHTSKKLESTLKSLSLHIEEKNLTFLAHPQLLWPTSWYMYKSNFYSHLRGKSSLSKWDFILAPSYDREYFLELKEDYDYTMLSFRHWWEPDYSELSLQNFLTSFMTHQPWNESERMYVYLYERKKFKREFLKSVQTSD